MEDVTKKEIGLRISKVRTAKKMTQKDLAEAIGTSRQIINYYEAGSRQPKLDDIINISKHLGISSDYLLCLSEVESTNNDIKAVCEYTKLTETSLYNLECINFVPKTNLYNKEIRKYSLTDILNRILENINFFMLVRETAQYSSHIYRQSLSKYLTPTKESSVEERNVCRDELITTLQKYNEFNNNKRHLIVGKEYSAVLKMRIRDSFDKILNEITTQAEQEAQKEIERIKAETE